MDGVLRHRCYHQEWSGNTMLGCNNTNKIKSALARDSETEHNTIHWLQSSIVCNISSHLTIKSLTASTTSTETSNNDVKPEPEGRDGHPYRLEQLDPLVPTTQDEMPITRHIAVSRPRRSTAPAHTTSSSATTRRCAIRTSEHCS